MWQTTCPAPRNLYCGCSTLQVCSSCWASRNCALSTRISAALSSNRQPIVVALPSFSADLAFILHATCNMSAREELSMPCGVDQPHHPHTAAPQWAAEYIRWTRRACISGAHGSWQLFSMTGSDIKMWGIACWTRNSSSISLVERLYLTALLITKFNLLGPCKSRLHVWQSPAFRVYIWNKMHLSFASIAVLSSPASLEILELQSAVTCLDSCFCDSACCSTCTKLLQHFSFFLPQSYQLPTPCPLYSLRTSGLLASVNDWLATLSTALTLQGIQ